MVDAAGVRPTAPVRRPRGHGGRRGGPEVADGGGVGPMADP